MERKKKEEEDEYGDYVTRCICDFKHDDGYMICCDECSVWQHVECMQVDPKNLPENYLCEECEPRPVDKRRARQVQIKKRENLADHDDSKEKKGQGIIGRLERRKSSSSSSLPPIPLGKKRRKKGKMVDTKPDISKRQRKDSVSSSQSVSTGGIKKAKRKPSAKPQPRSRLNSSGGSIQSLLNAASLLDGGVDQQGETDGKEGAGKSSRDLARKFSVLWNANYSPWSDEYDTITDNKTSDLVQKQLAVRLSQLKSEAVVYSAQEYATGEGKSGDCDRPHPQCSITEVIRRRKGVVADVNIPEDELVMEYNGTVTLKSDILPSLPDKTLWKHTPCPFIYQYDKIADLDICIDARNHGNMARFIRRSCSPNAELRHFFVEDELHFGVYALNDLSPLEEVTLPFDFEHDKCEYPVECACGQVKMACLIAMATSQHQSTLGRVRGVAKSADVDEHSVSSGRGRPRSHSHVLVQDEDSNSSWTSTASLGRKRKPHPPKNTPLSPKLSRPTSHEESSESESETGKRRKSLTREERKTEQVWKMFEKMEASAQRKRQQLVSEGSLDSSDPLTSPLHTRQHPHSSTGKERKSSGSARKYQLLHSGKMRLSSVSSGGDPLSPCDLSEAFSPPITPGLAPPASEPSSHTLTAPLMSPLTPSALKPTVEVTPYLHPKYLLEDFVLPWKKAFLRKWESEKLHNGETPMQYSYWSRDCHTHHAYHMTSDVMRPRVRGSLKHRWLKKHIQELEVISGVSGDKENRYLAPLPHKKQVLLRWQQSEIISDDRVAMETSNKTKLSRPEEGNNESKELLQVPTTGGEDMVGIPSGQSSPLFGVGVSSGRSSPLFDELSDGEEFEFPRRKRRTSENKPMVKEMLPSDEHGYSEMDVVPSPPHHGPHTPPSLSPHTPPSHGSLPRILQTPHTHSPPTPSLQGPHSPSPHTPPSPITEQMDMISDTSSNQPLPPDDHMMSHDCQRKDSICSDISDVSTNEASHTGPQTPPISQMTTPTLLQTSPPTELNSSQSPIIAHHVNISDISSDMDSSFSHTNSEPSETDITREPNPPPTSLSPHTLAMSHSQRLADTATTGISQTTSKLGIVPEGQSSSSLSNRKGQRLGGGYEDITPSEFTDKTIDSRLVQPVTEPHSGHEQGLYVEPMGVRLANEERLRYDTEGRNVDDARPPATLIESDLTTPDSPSASAVRTPVKRKINLSEYRNRARKPADRKSSTEKPATPPLLTPLHTPTIHYPLLSAPTLPPNSISRPALVDTSSVDIAAPVSSVSVPQFEPVSPDDGDHTPPLGTLEGQPSHCQPMVDMVPRDLSTMDPNVTQSLSVGDHPQSLVMVGGYGQPLLQQPQGMPVHQVMWSPSGVEAHDPRRGPILSGDRQPIFHHAPDPHSSRNQPLMPHPLQPGSQYVMPQGGVVCHPGGPQNIMVIQQGDFHRQGFGPPTHHHAPASQGYLPRHPGPAPGNNYYQ